MSLYQVQKLLFNIGLRFWECWDPLSPPLPIIFAVRSGHPAQPPWFCGNHDQPSLLQSSVSSSTLSAANFVRCR